MKWENLIDDENTSLTIAKPVAQVIFGPRHAYGESCVAALTHGWQGAKCGDTINESRLCGFVEPFGIPTDFLKRETFHQRRGGVHGGIYGGGLFPSLIQVDVASALNLYFIANEIEQ